MNDSSQTDHERLRQEGGPTSRRRRALARLRAMAGRYRKRYWAAVVLAFIFAGAFALTAAGVFEDDRKATTLGTGRAGVMPADSTTAQVDSAAVADSSARAARDDDEAQADNTNVVEAATEEIVEEVGRGEASYYGRGLAGNPTASGETFDPAKMTAAHRTLPLGSRVRVTHLRTGEAVVVRINDRGPFHGNRILDLSRRAAERIGMVARGKARVKIELLEDE